MSNSATMTIDLSDLPPRVRARLDSGEYAFLHEAIRDGLNALDREEATFDRDVREKLDKAVADPRPSVPADEVFDRLERKYAALAAAESASEAQG